MRSYRLAVEALRRPLPSLRRHHSNTAQMIGQTPGAILAVLPPALPLALLLAPLLALLATPPVAAGTTTTAQEWVRAESPTSTWHDSLGSVMSWEELPIITAGTTIGHPQATLLDWLVDDLDGDGWDELVTAETSNHHPGTTCLVFHDFPNGQPQTARQLNVTDFQALQRRPLGDLDGDGAGDVGIACKRGSRAWGLVYSHTGRLLLQTEEVTGDDRNADGLWDGTVLPYRALDLDGDGRNELLTVVSSAFDLEPRALLAIDAETGRERWRFSCGSLFGNLHVVTAPADATPRLILTTCGVCNGSEAGGYPDDGAYVFVLNGEGELQAERTFGGECAKVSAALGDLDGNERLDLVVALNSNFQLPNAAFGLYLLDPFTLAIERHIDPGTYLDPLILAASPEGPRPDILSSHGHRLYRYDAGLRLREVLSAPVRLTAHTICDFGGDGHFERVMVPTGESFALVLADGARPVARAQAPEAPIQALAPLRWGPRDGYLLAFTHRFATGWKLDPLPTHPAMRAATPAMPWWRLPLVLLTGLLLGALGARMLYTRRPEPNPGQAARAGSTTRTRSRAHPLAPPKVASTVPVEDPLPMMGPRPEPDPEAAAAMRLALAQLTAFGHGEPGAILARVATLLQAATPELIADPEWRLQARASLLALRSTQPALMQALLTSRPSLAQLEIPIERILAEYQRISRQAEALIQGLDREQELAADATARLGSHLQAFDRLLAQARRTLRRSFRCELTHAVSVALMIKQPMLAADRIEEHQVTMRGQWGNYLARIDCHRFIFEVLDDLITNASRAMRGCPVRRLTIALEQIGDVIRLRVSDTGRGVAPGLRDSMFDRGVSSRSDSNGLGLFQAQATLREFGGSVFVEESDSNAGTTITVELPVAHFPSSTLSPLVEAAKPGAPSAYAREAGGSTPGAGRSPQVVEPTRPE